MEKERSLGELLEVYMDQEKFNRLEGRAGVENLCKIARVLGYKDTQYFGQFLGGCIGDLIEFLEDNPGALQAIATWIEEQDLPEWKEAVESELEEESEEEEIES